MSEEKTTCYRCKKPLGETNGSFEAADVNDESKLRWYEFCEVCFYSYRALFADTVEQLRLDFVKKQ